MCPAIYLTIGIVKSTFFESAANNFINKELNFENTQVLDRKISYEKREIKVVLIGSEVPDASIALAKDKLKEYKLEKSTLIIHQGMNNEGMDISSIRAMVMEDFYKNSEQRLLEQQKKISLLEKNLQEYKEYDRICEQLVPELKVLYPSTKSLSIARTMEMNVDSMRIDTLTLAVMKFDRTLKSAEKDKISDWLKARLKADRLRLIVE